MTRYHAAAPVGYSQSNKHIVHGRVHGQQRSRCIVADISWVVGMVRKVQHATIATASFYRTCCGQGYALAACLPCVACLPFYLTCAACLPCVACPPFYLPCAAYLAYCPQPDAKDRFMEAKAAFETLTDDKRRAEYDRRLRMVRAHGVRKSAADQKCAKWLGRLCRSAGRLGLWLCSKEANLPGCVAH